MGKDIQQSVELPASPEVLFEMYIDAEQHSALTGSEAVVSREPGSAFSAFGGALSGRIIATVPGRLVVQTWRSVSFAEDEPDSILVLAFSEAPSGGRIDLVHTGVADSDYDGVNQGWRKFYWDPWRAFLEAAPTRA